ncbi:MAG: pentapeptide repeat-containing protein [Pirellulaceae bacterium]
MRIHSAVIVAFCVAAWTNLVPAEIYRTDGQWIPGTEGIEPGPGVVLDGWDLHAANLASLDLSNSSFVEANLASADLRSKLSNANLIRADLTDANLAGSNLYQTNLAGATLNKANLSNAIIRSGNFVSARFQDANLENVKMLAISDSPHLFALADFSRANLEGADLSRLELSGANFTDAILRDSKISFSQAQAADFTRADFTNAELRYRTIPGLDAASFREARFDHAILHLFLRGKFLDRVDLTNATYNQWTTFPRDFVPEAHGMIFVPAVSGDLNGDRLLTVDDIDAFYNAPRFSNCEGCNSTRFSLFDLNQDQRMDVADRITWIHDFAETWMGDANLDGQFDSQDLVLVMQASQFERRVNGENEIYNATWADGDWNGDRRFNSQDFVLAFQDGGYDAGMRIPDSRNRMRGVPEPDNGVEWTMALLAALVLRNLNRPARTKR